MDAEVRRMHYRAALFCRQRSHDLRTRVRSAGAADFGELSVDQIGQARGVVPDLGLSAPGARRKTGIDPWRSVTPRAQRKSLTSCSGPSA